MKIYLVRHGNAENKDEDAPKVLSTLGKKEVRAVGRFLASAGVKVSYVFHSGKTRAEQTAELLAKAIAYTGKIETRSGMEPNDLVSPFLSEINQLDGDSIYVGHMPFMGKFLSRIMIGTENYDIVAFHTATVVCLEKVMSSHWTIRWTVYPELLFKKR